MFGKDLRYAARTLQKSPVFSVTAVFTIALGIAASTAVFSVTNAVLLRPLPYKEPDRLVFAVQDLQKRGVKDFPLSNANFIDLRNGTAGVFEDLAGITTGRALVPNDEGSPEQVRVAFVTPNMFRLLGASTILGRGFIESDGQAPPPVPAAAPVTAGPAPPAQIAVVSYEYWKRRFGGNTKILGQPMPGSRPGGTQVVGVLAPRFELLFPADANIERTPDVWYAARLTYDPANRNNVSLRAIGRL
jgi:putative ABC transport system permease protein